MISSQIKGEHIQFLIDNRTACCYINKQGGTKSVKMNTLASRVWRVAETHNIHVSAMFIKGKSNVIADMEKAMSLQTCFKVNDQILKSEWMLAQKTFKWIVSHSPWDEPEVNMFANSMTNQLPKYMSLCPEGQAIAVNALVSSWQKETTLYAFPPTTTMAQVFLKI